MGGKGKTCRLKEQKEPTLEEKEGMDKQAGARLGLTPISLSRVSLFLPSTEFNSRMKLVTSMSGFLTVR